jgi:hypothetical protein
MKAVTSTTIEAMFSVESVQSTYKRSECKSKSVQGSYESVVSRRSESRRIFRGSRVIEDEIARRLHSDLMR